MSTNSNSALLVIDVQTAMFDESNPVYNADVLLERINGLLAKARAADVPVIYVQHNEGEGEELETGSPAWEINAAIAPREGELRIQKYKPDSFYETDLQRVLSERGVGKLVITGLQTDMCVNATTTRAAELGYEIIVAGDTHSTWGSGGLTAEEIIAEHNARFSSFAQISPAKDIEF
ncbi:cysteine hydrolase family protein [Paenibacillus sp. CF384]|uniref:cysteine hydrolase family protein n=1 Tax=Paenibacillus sp. CF384 TaxID=1884382 RepID=UPI000895FFF4|nr:cysteine hydrolase family protein [Paenibacillus sp. CF384]SDW77989.1 Nicotinamidase-related amidase [Paenibacillus sp. CF384]